MPIETSRKEYIIDLMLQLEAVLKDYGGTIPIRGTPPGHLNQTTFARLERGILYPQQPSMRAWGMSDVADVLGFIARDWRDH